MLHLSRPNYHLDKVFHKAVNYLKESTYSEQPLDYTEIITIGDESYAGDGIRKQLEKFNKTKTQTMVNILFCDLKI